MALVNYDTIVYSVNIKTRGIFIYRNLLEIPYKVAESYGDRISHSYYKGKELKTHTFSDFTGDIEIFTAGLRDAGLSRGDHVSFFVNNRYEWICTDFALMALRTVSVPRGSDSTPKELKFIFNHSDSRWLIVENRKHLRRGLFSAM